jgi:hypothetical protein
MKVFPNIDELSDTSGELQDNYEEMREILNKMDVYSGEVGECMDAQGNYVDNRIQQILNGE